MTRYEHQQCIRMLPAHPTMGVQNDLLLTRMCAACGPDLPARPILLAHRQSPRGNVRRESQIEFDVPGNESPLCMGPDRTKALGIAFLLRRNDNPLRKGLPEQT